jgi:hypothetical protein
MAKNESRRIDVCGIWRVKWLSTSELEVDATIIKSVKGKYDVGMVDDSFFRFKENITRAPLSSTATTLAKTSQDALASISGGEKSEATHCPQATETRTQGMRLMASGTSETFIKKAEGVTQL